jgi:hypothetical protein
MEGQAGSHEPRVNPDVLRRLRRELRRRQLAHDFSQGHLVVDGFRIPLPSDDHTVDRILARLDVLHAKLYGDEANWRQEVGKSLRGGLPGHEFDLSGRHISEKSG